jgi:hypothetical protein
MEFPKKIKISLNIEFLTDNLLFHKTFTLKYISTRKRDGERYPITRYGIEMSADLADHLTRQSIWDEMKEIEKEFDAVISDGVERLKDNNALFYFDIHGDDC